MKRMSRLVACALCAASSAAQAAIFRVDLSGSAYNVSPSLAATFPLGTAATVWFTYDSASPGESFSPGGVLDPSLRYYPDAPLNGQVTIGGYTAIFTPSSRIFVTDDEAAGQSLIDRFVFEDTRPTGTAVAGLPLNNFFINFQGPASTSAGLDLPTTLTELTAYGDVRGALDFGFSNDGLNRVSVNFDRVSISAVPEPTTWAMILVGFGMMGVATRYRHRSTATVFA